MKPILKMFLSLFIIVALLLNSFTFVFASNQATITIKEEVVDAAEGVKKLVFSVITPSGAGPIKSTGLVFSYDNTVIQPVRNDTYANVTLSSTSTDAVARRPFRAFANEDYEFQFAPFRIIAQGTRTAVKVDTYSVDAFDATGGMAFTEFYFKVNDGKTPNSDTFKLETDYSEGSFLRQLVPIAEDAITIRIGDTYNYGWAAEGETDNIQLNEFTYTGSDILTFGKIELTAGATSVKVPTLYPEAEEAATVAITATAKATNGATMALPSDAEWSLKSEPLTGVSLSGSGANATLTVAPAAAAGTAQVAVKSGDKEYTVDIEITREESAAAKLILKADGAETDSVTIAKPAREDSPAKTVTFTADVVDQYGDSVDADDVVIETQGTVVENTTFEDGVLTVPYGVQDGSFVVKAQKGTLTDEITVTICDLEIDWSVVEVSDITYGQTIADAVICPPNGTATAGDKPYNGTFSVKNGTDVLAAGNRTITVVFTVSSDDDYNGKTVEKTYEITVDKATYDMSGVTVSDKTVTYNGDTVSVAPAGTLPAGVSIAAVTYQLGSEEPTTTAPTNAGTYVVTVSFVGDEANYNAILDKTATLTINKADAVISAETVQTYTYDATEKSVQATLNHAEAELEYTPAQSYTDANEDGYTVTVTSAETTNYNAAEVTVRLVINKAAATGFVTDAPTYTWTASEAFEEEIKSAAQLKEAMSLPETVTVSYNVDATEDVDITWADATEQWNAKGRTYTFVGTPSSDNISFTETQKLVATAEITPQTVTFTPALNDITVAEASLDEANDYEDLGLPTAITLTLPNDEASVISELVWSKSLAELKELTANESVELSLDDSIFPEWATIGNSTSLTFAVTDKYPVKVTVTQTGADYGTPIDDPETTQEAIDYGIDETATFAFRYTGTTAAGEAYDSDVAPTDAGTYRVTATLVSQTHAGSARSTEFTIAPIDATYTVNSVEKKYKEANPVFIGELTSDLAYDDTEEDLGITITCDDTTNYVAGATATITATSTNKNYNFIVTDGTLTVIKKPLSDSDIAVPVVIGAAEVGTPLMASIAGIDSSEYTYQWLKGEEEIADETGVTYIPVIADSNKVIAVKVVANEEGNYSGETAASEALTVEKYVISGTIIADVTNGTGDEAVLDAGDTVTVDTSAVADIADLTDAGATFNYVWILNGTEIPEQTSESIEITEDMTGVLAVTMSATGDFDGSLTLTVGEIGKTLLTGTITLTNTEGVITYVAELPGVAGTDYNLTWYRGETAVGTGESYVVTAADCGQAITVKAIAAGETYTGEVVSNAILIPAAAPSNVNIATTVTVDSITVTLTADKNGANISNFNVEITDGDAYTESVIVTVEDGAFTYTFEGLTTDTEYTITATATNAVGTSEAATVTATPSEEKKNGGYISGRQPSKDDQVEADPVVNVVAKGDTVTLKAKDLKDKETVNIEFAVNAVKVGVTADIAGTVLNNMTVTAEESEVAVTGKATEGIVGAPIVVTVSATGEDKEEIDVPVNVTVASKEQAYAYVVDEIGNTTRIDSVYNAENATVEISGVTSGTVVVISTVAPSVFDDVEGRWSEKEIEHASDLGLVNGKAEGRFDPQGKLTRHENNKLQQNIVNALKLNLDADKDVKIDTDENHWAFESDIWAAKAGITNGVGALEDGTLILNGEANITRQDYMTSIARLLTIAVVDEAPEGESIAFTDADGIADYAKDAVNLLSALGIVKGTAAEDGYVLNPTNAITREEATSIMNRVYEFVAKLS